MTGSLTSNTTGVCSSGITIGTEELMDIVWHGPKATVLASFWDPYDKNGSDSYCAGHIPASLLCDPTKSLAAVPSRARGRNPLPDRRLLAYWFRRWGLRPDRPVITYDDRSGLYAARAWWVLTWAGVPHVRIYDGGLTAWASKHRLAMGPGNHVVSGVYEPQVGQLPVASLAEVKAVVGGGREAILVDTRQPRRFAGWREILDLKAGHIPGAINIPSADLMNEDDTYKSPEEIRAEFARYGIDEHNAQSVIVYSGSGLHGAQGIALMHHAGLTGGSLFVGGWSQWCAQDSYPVEFGD